MPDPPRLAHAGRRENDLRLVIEIDHLRLVAGDRHPKPRKTDRVDALLHKRERGVIKAVLHILAKNRGGFHRERTVHIHLKILEFRKQILRLDPPDKIQHLLRTSHRERRYDQIAASRKRIADHAGKLHGIIRRCLMRAVTVGRLHDHVIRRCKILRILDERAVPRSDVSGKYDLALLHTLSSVLSDPHLNTGRSKQMPRIHKPDF